MTIAADVQTLNLGAVCEFFVLDTTVTGGSLVLYFHPGVAYSNSTTWNDVVWSAPVNVGDAQVANTYTRWPVDATGFEWNGKGTLPQPKIQVANVLGAISQVNYANNDLIGAKVIRKRTLLKYLDAVNFPALRNLFSNTDTFNTWTLSNVTVSSPALVGPTGQPVFQITCTGTSNSFFNNGYASQPAGTVLYEQIKAKAGNSNLIFFERHDLSGGSTLYGSGSVDLSTGICTSGSGVAMSSSYLGNGWWLCTAVYTTLGAGDALGTFYVDTYGTGGAGKYIYVCEPQLETTALTKYQAVGATWSANPTADPTVQFANDVYFVNRKSMENPILCEYELTSSWDVAGKLLPGRQVIQNNCPWKYRGSECGYSGGSYWDTNDTATGLLANDVCGKRLSSCQLRFPNQWLPFGGFPGAGLTK